jgi:hypothetical protein
MSVSMLCVSFASCTGWLFVHVPATPQRPNPELRIVDPLLISATAASASLYNFEPLRSTLGARDFNGVVMEYLVLVLVLNGCQGRTLVRTPRKSRGRQAVSALRDKVVDILRDVILYDCLVQNKKKYKARMKSSRS